MRAKDIAAHYADITYAAAKLAGLGVFNVLAVHEAAPSIPLAIAAGIVGTGVMILGGFNAAKAGVAAASSLHLQKAGWKPEAAKLAPIPEGFASALLPLTGLGISAATLAQKYADGPALWAVTTTAAVGVGITMINYMGKKSAECLQRVPTQGVMADGSDAELPQAKRPSGP